MSFDKACGLDPCGALHPTTKEIFNPSLQSEFISANLAQNFSFSLDITLATCQLNFHLCESSLIQMTIVQQLVLTNGISPQCASSMNGT